MDGVVDRTDVKSCISSLNMAVCAEKWKSKEKYGGVYLGVKAFFLLVVEVMELNSCFWLSLSFCVGVLSSLHPLILSLSPCSPLLCFPILPPSLHPPPPLFSPPSCVPILPPFFAAACCLARWSFGSPKCWCRCLSALRTSSMWCYVTPTGGVRMFWAGCRS